MGRLLVHTLRQGCICWLIIVYFLAGSKTNFSKNCVSGAIKRFFGVVKITSKHMWARNKYAYRYLILYPGDCSARWHGDSSCWPILKSIILNFLFISQQITHNQHDASVFSFVATITCSVSNCDFVVFLVCTTNFQ